MLLAEGYDTGRSTSYRHRTRTLESEFCMGGQIRRQFAIQIFIPVVGFRMPVTCIVR